MKFFNFFNKQNKKHSSKWTDEEKRQIIETIDARNKEIEVVRTEVFPEKGQPYCYYYDNGKVRAEGFYYSKGYDKKGVFQDEMFQGKNIEYHENGQISDVFYYKDGISTGEYYSYDTDGNLIFSQPEAAQNSGVCSQHLQPIFHRN